MSLQKSGATTNGKAGHYTLVICIRCIIFLWFIAKITSINAQNLSHLLDGQSPDKNYDAFLSTKHGKLRFRVVVVATGRVTGEFVSVFEPLQKTNERSLELATKAGVYWSEDSRYLVIDETYDGNTPSEIILISVLPTGAKRLHLPMKKIKAFSSRRRSTWDISFEHWLGKRKFIATLEAETLPHSTGDADRDHFSLLFKIGRNERISVYKSSE